MEQRRHPMLDFSGGMVPDKPIRIKGNELLQAKNVILNPGGDFEKRKGTELLTSSGISVNPVSDIWGVILRFADAEMSECGGNGGTGPGYYIWWMFESTGGEVDGLLDKIIIVDFLVKAEAQAFYDAWVAEGFAEFSYADTDTVCGDWTAANIAGAIDEIDDAAHYNNKTIKTLSQSALENAAYCIHGMWTEVAAAAGREGEGSFDVEEDIMNSGIELSRRDEDTNARTRIRLATYYDASTGYMVKLNHAGDNTLAVTSITELSSSIWKDGKPDWAVYQNKAFMVNGTGDNVGTPDQVWTDGTNVHNIGITKPGTGLMSDQGPSASGGALEDGTYRFKISYYRSTDYTAESNTCTDYHEEVCALGGSTQKVTLRITCSSESQVDKIRIYRTKKDSTSTYYYEQEATDTGATIDVDCGTVADDALSEIASDSGAGTGNERPPASNFICMAGDRAWYATETYIYYSQLGYPEQVPSVNLIPITPDDGESITNLASFQDYVIVQKQTKTFLLDANNPDYVSPRQISNNIGTIAKRSSTVCADGQLFMFLSQEGFYLCDGIKVQSVCDGRIYRNLMQNVDKSRIAYSEGAYYPNDMQYHCYTPYLNDQYRYWIYSFQVDCWSQWTWDFRPHSITLWTDENDIKRLVIGTFLQGVEDGRRSYFGHFVQADYEHYKDVDMSAGCGDTTITYQNIESTVITGIDFMGTPDREKCFNNFHIYLENNSTNEIKPVVTFYSDAKGTEEGGFFGLESANTGSGANAQIVHEGIQNEPSESDWQHGYDKIECSDYQSIKTIDVPIGEVHGKALATKFVEDSQIFFRVYGYMFDYQMEILGRSE